MGAFVRVSALVQGKVTQSTVLALLSLLRSCYRLGRAQGPSGLSAYLKACSIYTMRCVAGDALHNSCAFGMSVSLTRSGLPRIIPSVWRASILSGSVTVIRLTLTIFGLYRVLDYKGSLKLGTITSPGTGVVSPELRAYCKEFVRAHLPPFAKEDFAWDPVPLLSKGAHVHNNIFSRAVPFPKEGWTAQGASASGLAAVRPHLSDLGEFATLLGLDSEYRSLRSIYTVLADVVWPVPPGFVWGEPRTSGELPVLETLSAPSGRLAVKDEPGKVRVFAMVDCWSQWFLYPLHKRIFTILAAWKTDGTFDQRAAVDRVSSQMDAKTKVFSFDLSAATDRLPVSLQAHLLDVWCPGLGSSWQKILTERDYILPRRAQKGRGASVRYAVGQPMGAYSSWAMLALTHHAIVQFAARKSCVVKANDWFEGYAVLGDDIVIWDDRVAKAYLAVMLELGVEISGSKSLRSPRGVFEFAKRFVVAGVDATAIPLAAVAASSQSLSVFQELLRTLPVLPMAVLLRFLGFGYKVRGSLSRVTWGNTRKAFAAFWALQPRVCRESEPTWSAWFVTTGPQGKPLNPSWFEVIFALCEFVRAQGPRLPSEVPFLFSAAYMAELMGSVGSKDSLFPGVPFGRINEVEVLLAALFHGSYSELFVRGRKRVRAFDELFEQTCVPIGPQGVDAIMASGLPSPIPPSSLLSTGEEQSPAWREFHDPDRVKPISVSKWIRFRMDLRNVLRGVREAPVRRPPIAPKEVRPRTLGGLGLMMFKYIS